MTYALIIDGQIQTVGALPSAARRLDTGEWVCPVDGEWTPEEIAACGYVQVAETARPADTATDTTDYSVTLVDGVPTQTWTPRPWTTDELAARTARAARESNRTAIKLIVTDLQAEKARCDVVIAKTNATITGADTKDVARAGKRIADAAIELARFVQDQ